MATSGSVDYAETRNDIIKDALFLLGIVGVDETVSNEDIDLGDRLLNKMIKAWQGQGIHLWTYQEATVFLQNDQVKYSLNASTGDNASDSTIKTELSEGEAASATVINVDSSTGMTAADVIGIEQDSSTIFWTTIVSVDSATQVTITTGIDTVAGVNNHVYTFTTRLGRPLDISQIRLSDKDGSEFLLTRVSREEYFEISDKTTESTPLMYYYDPQLDTGALYLWPEPSDMKERLNITYTRSIEDFDSASDNPDFPQEWLEALTYNLALRLAPAYGKDQKAQATIGPMASQMLTDVLNYDNENTSVFMVPDLRI